VRCDIDEVKEMVGVADKENEVERPFVEQVS
jgi:hypothetical protein